MNWNKTIHDFGIVSKGSTHIAEFEYLGTKPIKEVELTCNCTGFKLTGNCLQVKWNIKPNPTASYQSTKTLLIIYEDDTLDELTLTAYIQV